MFIWRISLFVCFLLVFLLATIQYLFHPVNLIVFLLVEALLLFSSAFLYWKHTSVFRKQTKLLSPLWYRLSLITVGGVALVHSIASIWLLIYPSNEAPFDAYVKAVYFVSSTLTTIGYGDITPNTTLGRLFTILIQLTGVAAFGLIIGQVSSMVLKADRRKEIVREKLEDLNAFLKHYHIPKTLRDQIHGFYHHRLERKTNDVEKQIINELPHAIQHELVVYMNMLPISKLKLFEGCHQDCLKAASQLLEEVCFKPGEALMRKGDVGHDMFIISHGQVEVRMGVQVIAQIPQGSCVGEMALINDEVRTADVYALDFVDAFKLNKDKFMGLVGSQPQLKSNVERLVQARR